MAVLVILTLLWCGLAIGQRPKSPDISGNASCGELTGQTFKCPEFGFTYTVPFGWVDRTADMKPEPGGESGTQGGDSVSAASSKSRTLLAVFERPPGAPGETINSAVVIAEESLKDYRGIKTAADYLGPITELAEQRGFKMVDEPYEFAAGTRRLARADYSKERGKLTMFQSTLAMIAKGEIVSFTFIGGSEDEVDELIGSLKFAGGAPPKK